MTEDTQDVEAFDEEDAAQEQEQEVDANAEIREAFDGAVTDESDEDDIKMQMIGAGATFKNVTRLYNQFMIDAGLAISKEDRNQIVEDTMEGREGLDTEEGFDEAASALVDAIQGATDRSAAGLVRAYCKKNELDVYTKPKGAGGNRVSFANTFYEWLVEPRSEDEAKAYIQGGEGYSDTSDNVKKHESHYMGIWALANRIHNPSEAA